MRRYTDEERPVEKAACYDCELPYGSAEWIEAVVSDDLWELINPTYHKGAGLLCITCMAKRFAELGMSDIPVQLAAGIFVVVDNTQRAKPS